MVERSHRLDVIFGSLADPTRRDILERIADTAMSVSEIAKPYKLSLAAISKHLIILEKAKLIVKRRWGKQQVVTLSATAIRDASRYLSMYEKAWSPRPAR
jgi:DNA-binding transcriptional ArsR family regulator